MTFVVMILAGILAAVFRNPWIVVIGQSIAIWMLIVRLNYQEAKFDKYRDVDRYNRWHKYNLEDDDEQNPSRI